MMSKYQSLTVLGGGSFGTALVKIFNDNRVYVTWYVKEEDGVKSINTLGQNPHFLSNVLLDTSLVNATSSLKEAIAASSTIVIAIPSAFIHQSFLPFLDLLQGKTIFSAVKGIVPETGQIIGDYLSENAAIDLEDFGVISGPCHAEEIALERDSYLTVSALDSEKSDQMKATLSNTYIKVSTNIDIVGTEYAAVLKNVYAIAAGIASGLGYGDNFQSVLISNAIREMKRYLNRIYKTKRNISQSAYLGDLLVTAYSEHSRNKRFGFRLGQGMNLEQTFKAEKMIAEGAYAVKPIYQMAKSQKKEIRTPIIDAVYAVVESGELAAMAFQRLKKKLN
jgi:glycerol-3-phosphate dehydrogenase (NAD(P)+)